MSAKLSFFLNSHLRGGRTQTHTCFANGRVPRPLHVPKAELAQLRELVVNYARNKSRQDLSHGILSLTEKERETRK